MTDRFAGWIVEHHNAHKRSYARGFGMGHGQPVVFFCVLACRVLKYGGIEKRSPQSAMKGLRLPWWTRFQSIL